jgi:Flp pilus assembly protein TadG
MLQHSPVSRRRGVTVVECAIVYPMAFLLVLGLIVGGLGIFRYQQAAHLARAGARYAAVRGGQYEAETRQTPPNEQAIRAYVISQSAAMNIDPGTLSVQVSLNATSTDGAGNNTVTTAPWDSSRKAPYTVTSDSGKARQNTVSVTVTYQWLPEVFLAGPITLTSTATIPMQY